MIWTPQYSEIIFKENNQSQGIKTYGVVMPQNVISRNNVLYDWDGIKKIHKQLIGRPFMIQHEVDGVNAVSIGHVTDTNILSLPEIKADEKYNIISNAVESYNLSEDTEFWVYEADLNPKKEEFIDEIRRGDMRHVSIQLKADDTREEIDNKGNTFTVAIPTDLIELSGVYTPGFLQTCAIMAEKYGGVKMNEGLIKGPGIRDGTGPRSKTGECPVNKEDISTTTGAGAIAPTQPLDDKKEIDYKDYALLKCETCGNMSFSFINKTLQCNKCKSLKEISSDEADDIVDDLGDDVVDEELKGLVDDTEYD